MIYYKCRDNVYGFFIRKGGIVPNCGLIHRETEKLYSTGYIIKNSGLDSVREYIDVFQCECGEENFDYRPSYNSNKCRCGKKNNIRWWQQYYTEEEYLNWKKGGMEI